MSKHCPNTLYTPSRLIVGMTFGEDMVGTRGRMDILPTAGCSRRW